MILYYCYYVCFYNIFIFFSFEIKDSTTEVPTPLLWDVGECTVGLTTCVYV